MSDQKSLVLITIDCLRADHVGFMGYGQGVTPFLDSLAAESCVVPTAIVAGMPTYYSLPALMASRYPLALGRDLIGIAPGETTLASVLQEHGYATAAFSAANPYISGRFGYDRGFDTFCDFLDHASAEYEPKLTPGPPRLRTRINRKLASAARRSGVAPLYDSIYFEYCQRIASKKPRSMSDLRPFPAADVLVDKAISWLDTVKSRAFFLWMHFMDPHSPYYPSEANEGATERPVDPFEARYLNACWNRSDLDADQLARYREEVIGLYDASVRWVDDQVHRLVEALKVSGHWDDCLVALTADHGEEFLDHGGRYHSPFKLTEELIRVPLLLRRPGKAKLKACTAPFSLLHLAPTMLEALGLQAPAEFAGQSLWRKLLKAEDWVAPAIIETIAGCTNPIDRASRLGSRILAVRDRRFKLVLRFDTASAELFDLEADPAESNPVSPAAAKPVMHRLLQAAEQHVRNSRESRDVKKRAGMLLCELERELAEPRATEPASTAVPC